MPGDKKSKKSHSSRKRSRSRSPRDSHRESRGDRERDRYRQSDKDRGEDRKRRSKFDSGPAAGSSSRFSHKQGGGDGMSMLSALTTMGQKSGTGDLLQRTKNESTQQQQQAGSLSQSQQNLQFPFSYSLPSAFQNSLGTTLYARRIYVGNVQPYMDEKHLKEFLYETLKVAGGVLENGNPIISSSKNTEKKFIFFEFRSVEETSAAIQLDGIRYQDVNLRIRRPPEFDKNPEIKPRKPIPQLDTVALGIISTQVNDGPGKLFIGGLPKEYSEDQVKNLLQWYGRLKSFHLVKETGEQNSRGFGFCEYADDACAEQALSMLNGMKIGSRIINLRRTQDHHPSSFKNAQTLSTEEKENFFENLGQFLQFCSQIIGRPVTQEKISKEQEEVRKRNQETEQKLDQQFNYTDLSQVVRVTFQAITLNLLADDKEVESIQDDILNELKKFGKIVSFTFPTLKDLKKTSTIRESALGRAFVEFEEVSSAFACYNMLYERDFLGQIVTVEFFSRDQYITQSLF